MRRIPVFDEVGRLAAGFNRMLDRLQAAQAAQRRLVADASHELRTPVTSLRTNAELLRDVDLDDADRRAIAGDVVEQAEELTRLVGDVIELARDEAREPAPEAVRLDELAAEALERARRHAPGLTWALEAEPVVVDGAPERLARAVNNLLDNAASTRRRARGSRCARRGELTCATTARASRRRTSRTSSSASTAARPARAPGSGLGLAIVKQVADAHGAEVALEPAPGGGTLARLRFPASQTLNVASGRFIGRTPRRSAFSS